MIQITEDKEKQLALNVMYAESEHKRDLALKEYLVYMKTKNKEMNK